MKKLILSLSILGFGAVGCAHKQELPTEMTSKDMPEPKAPRDPQLAVTSNSGDANSEGRVELQKAINNSSVYFELNSSNLNSEGQSSLQKVATVMKKYPDLKLQVSGHADERGTEEYNLMLGQRRAEMARKYLSDLGVQTAQLDTISYGDEKPVDPNHNDSAWSKNRRDDLKVQN